jgi:rRNA maturation RNase YbeY
MPVQFFFADAKITLNQRTRLKLFIGDLFLTEHTRLATLSYIFCSDQYLLNINQQYLNHDDYTDIITFNLSEPNQPISGEIYISVDRVKENAQLLKNTINQELHRVIFHGALHLCGFKDKKPKDKRNMTIAEDRFLQLYFSK